MNDAQQERPRSDVELLQTILRLFPRLPVVGRKAFEQRLKIGRLRRLSRWSSSDGKCRLKKPQEQKTKVRSHERRVEQFSYR